MGFTFALDVLAVLVTAVFLGMFLFALRRRLLQRRGGTFDCSLRSGDAQDGRGWMFGVARYAPDRVELYRVFSYSLRPREVLERRHVQILARRVPDPGEEVSLVSDTIVLRCEQGGRGMELAMSENALTGFLSWLEAAPPGQQMNLAG